MGIFEQQIKPLLADGTSFREIAPQPLVGAAEEIGKALSDKGLKNHQLRKFYDAVKQIERRTLGQEPGDALSQELVAQLLFLRPHLANAERKERSIRGLREALDICLAPNVIQHKADLTRFVKFFEAIVAYAG